MENNAVAKIETEQQDVVVVPESASTSLMRMIERATMDPTFDVAKMQQLLDVKERWEANEARKAFVAAKAAFKAEAPRIDKNKHVGFASRKEGAARTDYRHATLDHVSELLDPVLSKCGLSYSWQTEQIENGLIRVTCILTHVLGHSERVTLQASPDQSGNKNSIQAVGSTSTYLSRYTLLLATGIATGDMDDDGLAAGGDGPLTEEQLTEIRDGIDDVGGDVPGFCKYMGVDALAKIPQSQIGKARNAIAAKKKGGAK